MRTLMRVAMIGGVLLAAACSNGPRKGFDTIGAGAAPGVSGGLPGPATSVSPTSPAMTTAAPPAAATKKGDTTTRRKP
jgi:hypothetical protein